MEIAVIGAGSGFAMRLIRGMYGSTKSDQYHFRLMDIRVEALDELKRVTKLLNSASQRNISYSFYSDRKEAIRNADHVLVCFAVDFPESFLRTSWVLKDHGINFVEGETATPGALMATLRHLPTILEIVDEIKTSTKGAWLHLINNPLPRLVLGVIKGSGYERVVGHCHGSIPIKRRIAELTNTPVEEIDFFVAGINHFHLVQKAVDKRDGKNLLEVIKSLGDDANVEVWKNEDYTQWKMFVELGYFFGHGIWHNFDYLPYANNRMFRHQDTNTWDRCNVAVLAKRWYESEACSHIKDIESAKDYLNIEEGEQIFSVIQALSGEIPPYYFLSGNAVNNGHITNLPNGCIVELPSMVSTKGVELFTSQEPLPLFFESWLRTQIAIHFLSVEAVLRNSRQAAIEAIACDPSFRDCDCSPSELLDDMLKANKGLVQELS